VKTVHYHFISLFPEFLEAWMGLSILGKAAKRNVFQYSLYQLRDFSNDKHRSVDDVSYGGGGGMVLRVDCLARAVQHIREKLNNEPSRVIYFSPKGKQLSHSLLEHYLEPHVPAHLILVCGHYEGVDQRFIDHWVDEEISLGDFVLTGGEVPALAFADALSRHLEGTLTREGSSSEESFSLHHQGSRLLEYPQYTRPSEFEGHKVPEILLSGDHDKIAAWRKEQSLSTTRALRPDLLKF